MSSLAYTGRVSMAHLTTTDRRAVERFCADVRREFPGRVQAIQVFGSKARGDAAEDSDVDLLVILTDVRWQDRKTISRLASRVFSDTGVDLAPAIYTAEKIERMKRQRNMFWQAIEPDLTSV